MKKLIFLLLVSTTATVSVFAQNDRAMLAEGCNYLGYRSYLPPGSYDARQLGIGDNRLSSFHLPNGMAIKLFELDNYLGRSETYYASVSCLSSFWNNRVRVSSVKIYWIHDPGNGNGSGNNLPPQGNNVIVYKDNNYSGMAKEMSAGNFSSRELGFLTDNISSIYIPPGHSVRVNDKTGRTQIFTSSVANLNYIIGWDNKINTGFIEGNYNGGESGGNMPPQGDRVIFYRDMKYSGMSRSFTPGSFSPGDLGFLKENITSIYIPRGQSVKVYDSRGGNHTFTTSVSDLSPYGWNDKITTGIISGRNNGPLPPQGSKVIFYSDMKYSGTAKEMTTGAFNSALLGNLSRQVSSIYIPLGVTVQVYDRNGRTQHFTNSISNLAQYGWDNKIYTGRIISSGGQQGDNGGGNNQQVILYANTKYQGRAVSCAEGTTSSLGFGAGISSIRIPPGYSVVVYKGPDLTGESKTFTSSVENLSALYGGWNDAINSVYVFRQ